VLSPEVEAAASAWEEDWKYPLAEGAKGERMVLLLNHLIPPYLRRIIAIFYAERGWRRHDELAVIKPRKIVGGMFEDLVTYVPVDQPGTPIHVPQDPTPNPNPQLWSVKPTLSETFEERPSDDIVD
jgi:hypothetical protein